MINYVLKRSKRKTMALHIRDGILEVRAPMRVSKRRIEQFVKFKADWITDKLAKSAAQFEKRESFELNYGDMILFRGKEYPIEVRPVAQCPIEPHYKFDGQLIYFGYIGRNGDYGDCSNIGNSRNCDSIFCIDPNLDSERIMAACIEIYKKKARDYLPARTLEIAKTIGVKPSAIKINGAKRRWGSCSSKGSINFSWRLMMAGDDVIDYVITHELAHLLELNHSPKFWSVVERALPDYKERIERLKELQRRLSAENWD
jgi:predicted metal-dependent hydrolase